MDGPPEGITPNPGTGDKTATTAEEAKDSYTLTDLANNLWGNWGPKPPRVAEQQRDLGPLKGPGQKMSSKDENLESRDPTNQSVASGSASRAPTGTCK